jgi:hypothetical protein
VADADADTDLGGGAAVTKPRDVPDEASGRPSEAREGREHTRVGRTVEGGVPSSSPIAARRAPPVSRRRRIFAIAGVLLVVVLAVAAVWIVNRQFWFVGTNDTGQVTLYRGLPYELPLGIDMYSVQRTSSVPASAIADRRQRNYVLDHHARGKGDSEDLLRQIESSYLRP